MLDQVPGLLTRTIPAIVMPRKTSSETRRPVGFAAKSLGDISHRLPRMNTDSCYSISPYMSLMLAEIAEQPAALERTIAEERAKIAKLGNVLKARDIHLIVLVARGSSDNAALFGRYLLEITTGIPVSLSAPSVHTLYQAKLDLRRALVVGVSQSGEGEDINRVLENARACGAFTIGITNEPSSSMVGLVDETLLMHGGHERSVAATKTFTGQMILFYMLSAALAKGGQQIDFASVPDLAARALEQKQAIVE